MLQSQYLMCLGQVLGRGREREARSVDRGHIHVDGVCKEEWWWKEEAGAAVWGCDEIPEGGCGEGMGQWLWRKVRIGVQEGELAARMTRMVSSAHGGLGSWRGGGTLCQRRGLCEAHSSEECPAMNTKGKKKRKGQRGLGDV